MIEFPLALLQASQTILARRQSRTAGIYDDTIVLAPHPLLEWQAQSIGMGKMFEAHSSEIQHRVPCSQF